MEALATCTGIVVGPKEDVGWVGCTGVWGVEPTEVFCIATGPPRNNRENLLAYYLQLQVN